MLNFLEKIEAQINSKIEACKNLNDLISLKSKFLGRKGEITSILKNLSSLPLEERKKTGKLVNSFKIKIESKFNYAIESLKLKIQQQKILSEKIDITIPGEILTIGHKHPLSIVLDRINEIFISMGFTVIDGDEIVSPHYNFDALNIPKNHPSRDLQDTFYLENNFLLRTQTSSVQIQIMETQNPPIRIISPGRVFRSDSIDATHSPIFHQIEGLAIDKNLSFADLKGTLNEFISKLFGKSVSVRFRPHYFPFTEPSAEADISCIFCKGKGCSVCKNEGWIEIFGCGMVHPNVLKNCSINSNEFSGFAFGLGLERIAMLLFEIDDIRLFYENDVRFLSQF